MPHLDWLDQRMEHCDAFAEHLYRQFAVTVR